VTEAEVGRDLDQVAQEQDAIGRVAELVASDATLAEEHGTGGVQSDDQRDQGQQR